MISSVSASHVNLSKVHISHVSHGADQLFCGISTLVLSLKLTISIISQFSKEHFDPSKYIFCFSCCIWSFFQRCTLPSCVFYRESSDSCCILEGMLSIQCFNIKPKNTVSFWFPTNIISPPFWAILETDSAKWSSNDNFKFLRSSATDWLSCTSLVECLNRWNVASFALTFLYLGRQVGPFAVSVKASSFDMSRTQILSS